MKAINCGDSTFFFKIYSLPKMHELTICIWLMVLKQLTHGIPYYSKRIWKPLAMQCRHLSPTQSGNYSPNIQHGTVDSLKFGSASSANGSRTIKFTNHLALIP
ncbi:MAG: hypothetical protein IPN18_14715 [Ignavibacteriales bacterium]|nr:hypothetical protein [Ignavibacteriales bacterium]